MVGTSPRYWVSNVIVRSVVSFPWTRMVRQVPGCPLVGLPMTRLAVTVRVKLTPVSQSTATVAASDKATPAEALSMRSLVSTLSEAAARTLASDALSISRLVVEVVRPVDGANHASALADSSHALQRSAPGSVSPEDSPLAG